MYRYKVTKSDSFRNARIFEVHDLISNSYQNVNSEQLKELVKDNRVTNMTLKNGRLVDCPDIAASVYSLLAVSEVEFEKMQSTVMNRRGYIF